MCLGGVMTTKPVSQTILYINIIYQFMAKYKTPCTTVRDNDPLTVHLDLFMAAAFPTTQQRYTVNKNGNQSRSNLKTRDIHNLKYKQITSLKDGKDENWKIEKILNSVNKLDLCAKNSIFQWPYWAFTLCCVLLIYVCLLQGRSRIRDRLFRSNLRMRWRHRWIWCRGPRLWSGSPPERSTGHGDTRHMFFGGGGVW